MGCTEVKEDRIASTLESLWVVLLITGQTQYICVLSETILQTEVKTHSEQKLKKPILILFIN